MRLLHISMLSICTKRSVLDFVRSSPRNHPVRRNQRGSISRLGQQTDNAKLFRSPRDRDTNISLHNTAQFNKTPSSL